MNRIIINKKIISDTDNVIIRDNEITIKSSGDYQIQYTESGQYNLTFIIESNVNIEEVSFDNNLEVNIHYIVNSGNLIVTKFYNNEVVKEKIDIDLNNAGSHVNYKFSNICKGQENYTININHNSRNTISIICNKSIALKNSHLHFVINSNVYKECNGSVLNQNTRIVTMGECDATICPNMFIDLEDVVAEHGSVIGTFKEDQVFYLMSKGISYNDTLKLLVSGYLFSNLIVSDDVKKKITDIIDTYWG